MYRFKKDFLASDRCKRYFRVKNACTGAGIFFPSYIGSKNDAVLVHGTPSKISEKTGFLAIFEFLQNVRAPS